MWVRCNPNPKRKHVPDCVIRALAIILDKTWYEVYDDLYLVGREEASVSCHDDVWGLYLRMNGFEPFLLPEADSKKLDLLTCTLSRLMKSLPYIEEYGYDQDHDLSGRRGRDSMGRYTSMDMSGHWPPQPPMWSGAYRGYPPDNYWR